MPFPYSTGFVGLRNPANVPCNTASVRCKWLVRLGSFRDTEVRRADDVHFGSNAALILGMSLAAALGFSQTNCRTGARVEGVIADQTGAVVLGAEVTTSNGARVLTDAAGYYLLACVPPDAVVVRVEAQGFAAVSKNISVRPGQITRLNFELLLAAVQADVQVNAQASGLDSDRGSNTVDLNRQQIQQLADDPDDFVRQLQVLAAESGGDPGNAHITVDGFQNPGAMPPKGSIASIRINPDLFSAEYPWPPYSGGLIEITTKPGTSNLHGALFFTGSGGALNATDPFSLTSTPAGKRRYGFELSGSLLQKRSDYSLALEKRDIDEFNVVNAKVLGDGGTVAPLQQTVPASERLWIASARNGWQLGPNDTSTISLVANVNTQGNQGVGGLVLPEAGYLNLTSEYDLRFGNTQTFGANLLHQTRIGYSWKRTAQTPNSTAPALQVAGYFTGGGSTAGNLNTRERDLEVDDDILLTHGKQTFKVGLQSLTVFLHNYDPDTFNGAFVFGGGSAPLLDANGKPTGQTTTIDGLQQYERTLQELPGGTPTTYQLNTGSPVVPLTQWRPALFGEDTIQLASRLSMATGLRYQLQTSPNSFLSFEPRLGFGWSPDKKSKWVLHLRSGIFHDPNTAALISDVYRTNGVRQQQRTIYSPSYTTPLVPTADSIAISTVREFPHSMVQKSVLSIYANVERDFPHQWHARVNFYFGEDWDRLRIRNINAPMVANSIGMAPDPLAALHAPRPFAQNENILEYQNEGHLAGNLVSMSLDQHSYKRFDLHFSYRHVIFKSDGGDALGSPQSSYSDLGESSRADWMRSNAGSFFGSVYLPFKIQWSAQLDGSTGAAYNITTGTDSNGDGIFNDRPAYASAPGAGTYLTPYGLLTTNTVNGNLPRNAGTLPSQFHLDTNLSREFVLNPKDTDHQRTFTVNMRSANVLNHTNIVGVNTVLSPTLGQPTVAAPARRIEFGGRFSF